MDTLRWIFVGPAGLRSGWRALAWGTAVLIAMIGLSVVAGVVLAVAGVDPTTLPPNALMVFNALLVFPLWLVTWLFVRFLDRRPLASVGLAARGSLAGTGRGTALGLVAISIGCLALAAGGAASVGPADPSPWIPVLALELLLAAAFEELLFRGYGTQWIARGAGFWVATILSSVAFAIVHGANPDVGLFALGIIFFSGVLLSFARAVSRDLWLPIGLHFGWNAAQGLVFGVPISGIKGWPSFLRTTLEGPQIVTGGGFGFEASLGGLVALVTAFLALAVLARRRRPDWRMEGGDGGAPSVEKPSIVG